MTPETHLGKINDKILVLKYECRKIKDNILKQDPTLADELAKRYEQLEENPVLTDEFVKRYEQLVKEKPLSTLSVEELLVKFDKINERIKKQSQFLIWKCWFLQTCKNVKM